MLRPVRKKKRESTKWRIKMKTGLVLEGGGMRGIYVAGVLDVFMEQELGFDGVIGNSAGAIHGCSFISNQKGRSLRYYRNYCGDYRFMSFRSLITTGDLVGVEFCYHELPEKLDIFDNEAFRQNPTPFYVVCTNLETGKAEYPRITDMSVQIDLLRASASMPYVSRIVEVDGKKYLDGGCSDSIPVQAFRDMGYTRNVVVLTRPADYRKKPEFSGLAKIVYRKYPAFAEALDHRYLSYNQTAEAILDMEKKDEIFVIRPEKDLEIGRIEKNPTSVERVYNTGREDALKRMEALKRWMKQ